MAPDKGGRDALEPSLERFLLTVTSEASPKVRQS